MNLRKELCPRFLVQVSSPSATGEGLFEVGRGEFQVHDPQAARDFPPISLFSPSRTDPTLTTLATSLNEMVVDVCRRAGPISRLATARVEFLRC